MDGADPWWTSDTADPWARKLQTSLRETSAKVDAMEKEYQARLARQAEEEKTAAEKLRDQVRISDPFRLETLFHTTSSWVFCATLNTKSRKFEN